MSHHWLLIAIFLVLTLLVPAVIALRVFTTAFSDPRSTGASEDAAMTKDDAARHD